MKRFDNSVKGLTVEVNDDFHRSIRTFTKKVQDSGKLRTLKEREFFESPSETKKKQKKAAKKRWQKKLSILNNKQI